jgi:hypothetical protein
MPNGLITAAEAREFPMSLNQSVAPHSFRNQKIKHNILQISINFFEHTGLWVHCLAQTIWRWGRRHRGWGLKRSPCTIFKAARSTDLRNQRSARSVWRNNL